MKISVGDIFDSPLFPGNHHVVVGVGKKYLRIRKLYAGEKRGFSKSIFSNPKSDYSQRNLLVKM